VALSDLRTTSNSYRFSVRSTRAFRAEARCFSSRRTSRRAVSIPAKCRRLTSAKRLSISRTFSASSRSRRSWTSGSTGRPRLMLLLSITNSSLLFLLKFLAVPFLINTSYNNTLSQYIKKGSLFKKS